MVVLLAVLLLAVALHADLSIKAEMVIVIEAPTHRIDQKATDKKCMRKGEKNA